MKKVILPILLMLLPMLACAGAVEIDGIRYNLIPKAKEAEVLSGFSLLGHLEIPNKITYEGIDYVITTIGDRAFYDSQITSLKIPNTITNIGNDAFLYGPSSIYINDIEAWCNINFKEGTYYLGPHHFHLYLNGIEIKNLIITEISEIKKDSFRGCLSLESVTFSNSTTNIGNHAFEGCTSLASINFANSVNSIGQSAFSGCTGISSVNIPNSVTTIGSNAFYGCTGLTSVIIPNSVTSIGVDAFGGCSELTSITIPNSVTYLSGFSGCISLTSLIIPNSVTTIGSYAFSGCKNLTSVTIGSGVNTIENLPFSNCTELTDVYCLMEDLPSIYGDNPFDGSYPQYINLHVPSISIDAYRNNEPWKSFKEIVVLEDGENTEIKKCATPEIYYKDGKLDFSCETEGIEFVSEVTVEDAKKYYDASVTLSQTYKVSVYATKAGYENSDVATREIVIENGQTSLFGDLNKDGKVNVADHVKLSDIIMNK